MDGQDLNGYYVLAAVSGTVLTYLCAVSAIYHYKTPRCLYNLMFDGNLQNEPHKEPKPDQNPTNSGGSLDERL